MRIAITNPSTWPRVRRGAERFLNELARFLAGRGHDVTVIACHPGPTRRWRDDGYSTVCHRRLWHPSLAKVGLLEFHAFAATALAALLAGRYDLVHCCTFTDTFAACVSRRLTRTPCVFWVNALPPRIRYFRSLTTGGAVFRRSIRWADDVIALSEYMRADFAVRFGRGGTVLPVPVDTERFALCRTRDLEQPVVFCAAALEDERKGGTVLMRAFNLLKDRCPTARLHIGAAVSQRVRDSLLEYVAPDRRSDVSFLGNGTLEELPARFGSAAVSVLPSMWEAFGMVVLESMSTGTPVVGTRSGALPELISNPDVGCLFDAGEDAGVQPTNAAGLADALHAGIELSRRAETALSCRAHAERYSWPVVGPRFEAMYENLVRARTPRRRSVRKPPSP